MKTKILIVLISIVLISSSCVDIAHDASVAATGLIYLISLLFKLGFMALILWLVIGIIIAIFGRKN